MRAYINCQITDERHNEQLGLRDSIVRPRTFSSSNHIRCCWWKGVKYERILFLESDKASFPDAQTYLICNGYFYEENIWSW